MSTDEEIIAEKLLQIKRGIVQGDWNLVIDAYYELTGEVVKRKEEKSKIQRIRDLIAKADHDDADDEEESEHDEPETESVTIKSQEVIQLDPVSNKDFNKMKIDDIRKYLISNGASAKTVNGFKNKKAIVKYAEKFDAVSSQASVQIVKHKPNSFAQGELKIISSVGFEDELEENEFAAIPKMKRERKERITDIESDGFSYRDSPKRKR